MSKHFDPFSHPKRSVARVTIYGNALAITGTATDTTTADISICGIKNETAYIVAGSNTDTSLDTWITNNLVFYRNRGFVLTKTTTRVVTVTPLWEWDTVNRINVAIVTGATGDISGTLTGTFEPDLNKAKTWQVTLSHNTVVKYPRNAVEGDRIRISIYNPSTYTVTWDTKGFFFVGGTEPTVTTTGYTTVEGVVNEGFYPRTDVITLTGTTGTATVTAGGVAKLATFASTHTSDLDQTGEDFYAAWVDYYAAVGLALTEGAGVLTFTATTRAANFHPIAKIANVTTDLSGTVVSNHEGRILCNTVSLDIKQ